MLLKLIMMRIIFLKSRYNIIPLGFCLTLWLNLPKFYPFGLKKRKLLKLLKKNLVRDYISVTLEV